MSRLARTSLPVLGLLLIGGAEARAQYTVFGITSSSGVQRLVSFNSANPGAVGVVGPTGAALRGIDFRPATGVLYGYDGSGIFTLSRSTGAASLAFDVGDAAGNPGFDFNPTVDRIRVVGPSGTNLRLNPITGGTTVDMAYAYAMGDASFGQTPSFNAVAYTNSDNDPSTGTTLFGIDANLGTLVRLSNPNGGAINTVGSLGLGAAPTVTGFDIVKVGGTNVGFFSTLVAGRMPTSQFYSVDLASGAATFIGNVGVDGGIEGIAVAAVPEPSTWALMATGLAGLAGVTRRRRRTA